MDELRAEHVRKLRADIEVLEERAKFWEDPRVIEIEDIDGWRGTGKQIAGVFREMIGELRQILESTPK